MPKSKKLGKKSKKNCRNCGYRGMDKNSLPLRPLNMKWCIKSGKEYTRIQYHFLSWTMFLLLAGIYSTRHKYIDKITEHRQSYVINRLMPNDPYMGRTAPLTSKRCILYIYSTNIGTEYFIHALYSPFFLSSKCSLFHNANLFGSCITHILYAGCAKIKKKIIPAPKG